MSKPSPVYRAGRTERDSPARHALPPAVTMPWAVSHPAAPGGTAPGQNAGWLGPAHDPFLLTADPAAPDFAVPGLCRPAGVSPGRLAGRRGLLAQVEARAARAGGYDACRQRALDLLTSAAARRAF